MEVFFISYNGVIFFIIYRIVNRNNCNKMFIWKY